MSLSDLINDPAAQAAAMRERLTAGELVQLRAYATAAPPPALDRKVLARLVVLGALTEGGEVTEVGRLCVAPSAEPAAAPAVDDAHQARTKAAAIRIGGPATLEVDGVPIETLRASHALLVRYGEALRAQDEQTRAMAHALRSDSPLHFSDFEEACAELSMLKEQSDAIEEELRTAALALAGGGANG